MKKQKGFTLLELMIVVVIVGILAAIAVPSYQQQMKKTRRADAKDALVTGAAAMERWFFTNNGYDASTAELANIGVTGSSLDGHYTVSRVAGTNPTCAAGAKTCFVLKAAPANSGAQVSDESTCSAFYITNTGKKTATGSLGDDCWQ